jgi:hypothetical protein
MSGVLAVAARAHHKEVRAGVGGRDLSTHDVIAQAQAGHTAVAAA